MLGFFFESDEMRVLLQIFYGPWYLPSVHLRESDMRSVNSGRRSGVGIDMNIAFALTEDVVTTKDHFGDHLLLDVAIEYERSSITIRSLRAGVLVCEEVSGPVYEAFPLAIREALYKWQEYKRTR